MQVTMVFMTAPWLVTNSVMTIQNGVQRNVRNVKK